MKVRTYRDGDEEAVLALWDRAGIARPWLDLRAEIVEKRRRDRSLFLVALEDELLVGAVMGAYDGRRGWVYHLAVQPDRQRGGTGALLMDALEQRMARLGVRKVNLQVRADNLGVCGFYERLGYRDEQLTSFGKWLSPQARSL
jgi:ribosomal protein S18 acetylase RimI-like enzyme